MNENRNLILAMVLSAGRLSRLDSIFVAGPQMKAEQAKTGACRRADEGAIACGSAGCAASRGFGRASVARRRAEARRRAHCDPDAVVRWIAAAERRAARRSASQKLSRDRRQQEPGDRPALTGGHATIPITRSSALSASRQESSPCRATPRRGRKSAAARSRPTRRSRSRGTMATASSSRARSRSTTSSCSPSPTA